MPIGALMRQLRLSRLDGHMQEVVRGASVALAVKSLAGALSFIFQVGLARTLGPQGSGRFMLALTCVTLATVIAKAGLDSVLVRNIATNASLGNWRSVVSVWHNSMSISIPVSLAVGFILFVSAHLLANRFFRDPSLSTYIRIMAPAVPLLAATTLHSEMLRGLKHVGTYQALQGVVIPGTATLGLLILAPFYGGIGAAVSYLLSTVIAAMAAVTLWRRALPSQISNGEEITRLELVRSGLPLLWAASMFFLNSWVATIVLGIYGTPKDVGLFNAANKLAWITTFVLLAVNSIAAPKFAAIYRSGSVADLERIAVQTTRLMMMVATPVLIACLIVPTFLLGLFGEEFRIAAPILQILVFGQATNVATGSAGQLLIMTGHEKDLRNLITSSAIINTVLAMALAAHAGLFGVAWSVAFSTIYTSIVAILMVRHRLGIGTHIFQRLTRG
jgi:O-antigen/teichoic acid export membrane protein